MGVAFNIFRAILYAALVISFFLINLSLIQRPIIAIISRIRVILLRVKVALNVLFSNLQKIVCFPCLSGIARKATSALSVVSN